MLEILMALTLQAADGPVFTLGDLDGWSDIEAGRNILPATAAASVIDGKVWSPGPAGNRMARWWTAAAPVTGTLCRRLAYSAYAAPIDPITPTPETPMRIRVDDLTQYAPSYPSEATTQRCGELEGWISLSAYDDTDDRLRALDRLIAIVTEAAGEAPLSFGLTIVCRRDTRGPCPDGRTALRDLPLDALYHIDRVRPPRGSPAPASDAAIEVSLGPAAEYNSWRVRIDDAGPTRQVTVERVMAIYH